jgi:hypothetical protein
MTILEAAKQYTKVNKVKVLPLSGKVPALPPGVTKWEPLREIDLQDDELSRYFDPQQNPAATGIGIITGTTSGNLEVLDIDSKNDNIAGRDIAAELINIFIENNPSVNLVTASTPSGGTHIFYRCSEIGRSQILAKTTAKGTLIETLAEGKQAAAYPSPGREFSPANFTTTQEDLIPILTPQQRNSLLTIARSFHQLQEPEQTQTTTQTNSELGPACKDYNQRGDTIQLLKEASWTIYPENKRTNLINVRRPPNNPGEPYSETSGNYHTKYKTLYVWSSSTQFPEPRAYKPAEVFSVLKCNNNLQTTEKELKKQGYGPDTKLHTPSSWRDIMELMSRNVEALKTGYKELDRYTGINPAAITLIAGRTGQGKTTFMLNLLIKQALINKDKKFYFFSYEEPQQNIYYKLLSIVAGKQIKGPKEIKQGSYDAIKHHLREGTWSQDAALSRAIETMSELVDGDRIEVVGENYSVEKLCEIITHRANEENIGAVFIDYAQRIHPEKSTDGLRTAMVYVSATILKTAKNTGLPIILGAQINREGANNDGKTIPQLHNLKESGSLEEDANNVWVVYCPPLQTAATKDMQVHILKNREGDTGEPIILKWNRPEWKID